MRNLTPRCQSVTLLCLTHNNDHKIFLIKLRQQKLSAQSVATFTLGCTKIMWHFPACKLQYLQYSYHLRRKLVQLTPVDLSLFNWSSISTLILSGESTITMDLFLEQFSLQRWSRWSQRVGTNLSKKVIYRACWLQYLLLPFHFGLSFKFCCPLDRRTFRRAPSKAKTSPGMITVTSRRPFSTVDKGWWAGPYSGPQIELYQISPPPDRGRSGYEITICSDFITCWNVLVATKLNSENFLITNSA